MRNVLLMLAITTLLPMGVASSVMGDEGHRDGQGTHVQVPQVARVAQDEHEEARRAREAGLVVSLETILEAMEPRFKGELVEVDLDEDDGRWFYEIELLTSGGKILELKYDAGAARLIEIDGKPAGDGGKPAGNGNSANSNSANANPGNGNPADGNPADGNPADGNPADTKAAPGKDGKGP